MNSDEKLRRASVVFYKSEMARIEGVLEEFLELSKAKSAMLVDKDGHLITKRGHTGEFDTDTISALVAGSFAATKEVARMLGEDEFSVLFHQGRKGNIQLALIGDRTLAAIVFDDRTTVGLVRLYAADMVRKLEAIFEDAAQSSGDPSDDEDDDFGAVADDKLDGIFGD